MISSSECRPRLLVSVRATREAEDALAGGADILDVKEPDNGSLGPAPWSVIGGIAELARENGNAIVTAALGELRDIANDSEAAMRLPLGLTLVKVGFAGLRNGADWRQQFARLQGRLAAFVPLIPAAYADAERAVSPDVRDVVELAIAVQSPFVLIDTCVKDERRLWDWLPLDEYAWVWERCRAAGVCLAMAGSMDRAACDRFADRPPDVIAVRGAACAGGDRRGSIDRRRVRELKDAITARVWSNRVAVGVRPASV